ncbi:MAG: T9SS type A sorting domain-containing protein [Flavobacterium sp.]|uniref:DUF7619 domain-containing protein n=1 Tax=Flavobacterium sp. TaxID=239 RepID=UPI0022BC8855|nr:leucine-rich repeat domain-containing protein [Flavobacterium sp.]MCZ8197699.1 T9SS type A sorting domain-containing protein [Flavobacterium sp.]
MKKFYFTLVTFLFLAVVNAQIVNIPDPVFKAKLLAASPFSFGNQIASSQTPVYNSSTDSWTVSSYIKIDTNNDGEIQVSEAQTIKFLRVGGNGLGNLGNITNLEGIASFTNVIYLYCSSNALTSLNVQGLTNLQTLNCTDNQLTSLNVQGLTNLKDLRCGGNQLTSLNVQGLTNLQRLYCSDNQLTSLNIQGLTNLRTLDCNYNQLTSLNVQGLTNFQTLNCMYNQLTSLNVQGLSNLQSLDCKHNQLTSLNVQGLTNLQTLNCIYNGLTSLNVQGLSNLQTLDCYFNQLTSLNVQGLTNLYYLDCYYNQLPSLDVQGLTNLQTLNCIYNDLTSLNVQGLTNLQSLNCKSNQLSSLNVQGLTNLQSLNCNSNQLTSLNVQGLTNLQTLDCSFNQLPSLNVQGLTNLNYLVCNDNQLTSLFIKNGNPQGWVQLWFHNNNNLAYICADEEDLTYVQNLIPNFLASCQVNSYCSFNPGGTFYTIQGNNNFDGNNNGCDTNDSVYPNLKFNITDGTNTGSLISNSTGNYSIPVSSGTHTITPQIENPTYFTLSPNNAIVTFPTVTSPAIRNFCIVPNGTHHDLEVVVIPLGVARPGFDAKYKIKYKNKGTTSENATVIFNYNDAILDFVSSIVAPTSQATGTLTWNIGAISPFQSGEILVTLNLNSPTEAPPVNAGTILNYTATVNGINTDETTIDNTFALNQTVVNSFDPNDKKCLEGVTISSSKIGEYVHYQIRFENSGTYPAQNIVVKDIINTTKFDVSTLQMTDASHSCVTRITNPNKVEFIFENINLPFDDANNDGYVVFKIKTKPTLVVGNTISNSANIYFDYNFPIVTNTATSTFSVLQNDTFEFDNYFTIYPNPVDEVLNLTTKQATEIYSLTIYNLLGQQVQTTTNPTNTIDVSSLKTGNYIVKVVTDKGVSSSKFVKE